MIDIKMIEKEMKQQDVTNEQMAEALGVNSEYVKKRAYRAKIKLKSIVVEKEEVEL